VVSLDATLDFLGKTYGLHSPEWSAWRARMRAPKINGKWLISARIPGKGKYYGDLTIAQGAAPDEFTTTVKLQPVSGGPAITRTGAGLVYTGFSWRGRSHGGTVAANATPDDLSREMRESLWISPDQTWAEGRWFWGEYQEFGMDVTMRRATGGPIVSGVDVAALKAGSTDTTMRIFGDNLPANLTASDVDLGAGVKVTKIVSQDAGMVTVSASVDAKAAPGTRTISVKGAAVPNAFAVYDKMDFLKVSPVTSLAHLGSSSHPKGYAQFETVAYSNGPDGKPNTADDIELGPVPATYKLEEFVASYGDDDTHFVGSVDSKSGLFTPGSDGPDPKRKSMRNNYGDVWVTGTYLPPGTQVPLVGRSYLVVAVPTYQNWDQPEVGQ
jgi:quinohemoprotein amine dehydrogenase